jgi:hypothetical protein
MDRRITMKHVFAKSLLGLAATAGLFALPTTAHAGDRYYHHDRDHVDFRIGVGRVEDRCEPRRVWVEPVFEERKTQVWVEPVYRTECVPVVVPERCETKCERVWIEPAFEVRDVVSFRHGRRFCSRERVCVRDGHWENVERRVVIPAHEERQDRPVLVTAGHYETRCDRVCVREGHWETVAVDRPGYDRDRLSLNIGLGGRF